MEKIRCNWAKPHNPLYLSYHDTEWGVPVYDDKTLFEFLVLESFQAGLSWEIILNKREGFRKAFANFDVEKIARFTSKKESNLQEDTRIIRNRLKISAAINNARRFLEIQEEFGSFSLYIWQFVDGKPITNYWKYNSEIPVNTKISDSLSKDLKQRGFKFMGSTVCYAHMQATGMVNDHLTGCFRHGEIAEQVRNSESPLSSNQ